MSGFPLSPPGDLLNPGTEPRCPALQVDSLPSESPGTYTLTKKKKIKKRLCMQHKPCYMSLSHINTHLTLFL